MEKGRDLRNSTQHKLYHQLAVAYLGNKCMLCDSNDIENLEIHHKDGDWKNNELDNLEILCEKHHPRGRIGKGIIMGYGSTKKIDQWSLNHMKEVFEALKILNESEPTRKLMREFGKSLQPGEREVFARLTSWGSYESYMEIIETIQARMDRESARIRKIQRDKELASRRW